MPHTQTHSATQKASAFRFDKRSQTRKEKVVYHPTIRDNLFNDRYMNLEKFMMMIQNREQTGEMFLREKFTADDAFKLLAAIGEKMKQRAHSETVAANAV